MIARFAEAAMFFNEVSELSLQDPYSAIDKLAGFKAPPGLEYLYAAIVCECGRNVLGTKREIHLEGKFYKNLDTYLPGAKKRAIKLIPGHKPDGFVEWNGKICPVEIKRSEFRASSLDQLRRYMKIYRSEIGIAVAPSLKCAIPENVIFISASF